MAKPSQPRNVSTDTAPGALPDMPTPRYAQSSHDFTLQAVMEMQKSLGQLSANVDHLITDVKGHGEKLEAIRHQSSFMKGGLAASVFFITAIIGITGWILNTKWDAVLLAVGKITTH